MKTVRTFMPFRPRAVAQTSQSASLRALPVALPAASVSARMTICEQCPWQLDWVCQHPGCDVCPHKQKSSAPLKALLESPAFRCPAKKF